MSIECAVDGSIFSFEEGWQVEKLDDWPEQQKLTAEPFCSKGCDIVAVKDKSLWMVEVKDYTYPGAKPPSNLVETVGLKVFHSLAVLHAVAHWGGDERRRFSRMALRCRRARVCLAVELPDNGRGLQGVEQPLAHLKADLKRVTKRLNIHGPVISNSRLPNDVPWHVRRDPTTRHRHADR